LFWGRFERMEGRMSVKGDLRLRGEIEKGADDDHPL
jgi:hypothetical protein